jgi:hypothetical protein
MATLCVALMAFVLVESAYSPHAASNTQPVISYDIATVSNDDQSRDGPAPMSSEQQQHCCSAHAVGMPAAWDVGAFEQAATHVNPWPVDQQALDRRPDGLDRPPKLSAIA